MKRIYYTIFLLIPFLAGGQIINIPDDYPTIQQGIDASNNGDTVLVDVGTYIENISFNARAITVASHFLVTGDTSFISQTIIDGNQEWGVVSFSNNDTLNAVLSGFTITNGLRGISCGSYSNPLIKNMKIVRNSNGQSAGGIYIGSYSTAKLENIIIKENSVYDPNFYGPGGGDIEGYGKGGGIYCASYSTPELKNVIIKNNTAGGIRGGFGGGMYLSAPCGPVMKNVTISDNNATRDGYGGGMCYRYVFIESEPVKIPHLVKKGEKMKTLNRELFPVFDSLSLCNIYLNKATQGNDLYFGNTYIKSIVLDTFTVMIPTEFHASPLDSITFNILNTKLEQANADLYISPGGNDNNSGLTADQPLKSIHCANSKIIADSLHPRILHLAEGLYSSTATREVYPICMPDYVSLEGISENTVFLDAEEHSGVLYILDNFSNHVSGLTITGGSGITGGGIYCYNSSPSLENLNIKGNSAWFGGGINIVSSSGRTSLKNLSIHGNLAKSGGGMYILHEDSTLIFDSISRCDIYSNMAIYGNDLYNGGDHIDVIVDTFTVFHPTEFHAFSLYPPSSYSFDILHNKLEQKDADLYVSPDGNNTNSGLTESEPLRNIHTAFSVMKTDTINQRTVHLMEGTYSPSTTGEFFPLNIPDYLNLEGISKEEVVLDAEGLSSVIYVNKSNLISGITITGGGGNDYHREGIYCNGVDPMLKNLIITGNSGEGIECYHSNPIIKEVAVSNNIGGGISLSNSNPSFENVNITNNLGIGGLRCMDHSSPVLKNVLIAGNLTYNVFGGLHCGGNCNPILENVTITGNSPRGIYISRFSSNPSLINTICWENANEEIRFSEYIGSSSVTIAYSNIKGGVAGIVNSNNDTTVNWLEGNIDQDPLFSGTAEEPYSLVLGSPCINAGTIDTTGLFLPLTDIAGNPRIWGDRVDMGAYEWNNLGIDDELISNHKLLQVNSFPNPFTTSTTLSYTLLEPSDVTIRIFNSQGQLIEIIKHEQLKGEQQVQWNAEGLPAGLYIIRLQAGNDIAYSKLLLAH